MIQVKTDTRFSFFIKGLGIDLGEVEDRLWAQTKDWASGQEVRSWTFATVQTRAVARHLQLVLCMSNMLDLPSAPSN